MKLLLLFELTIPVLLIWSNFAIAEFTNDSLNYLNIRKQVLLNDATDQTVPTSDALFEAGLFSEAVSLLQECALLKPSNTISSLKHNKNVQWRISSGADYFHLKDFDTVAMTSEELREHNRLTETPLSIWLKAKSSIKPESTLIEEISPEIYISERKSRLETTVYFLLPEQFFRIESSVKGEKWFRSDASGESPFEPIKSQPSDMGGADLLLNFSNHVRTDAKLNFSIPASVEFENYRKDRAGYESFVQYSLFPSFEISHDLLPVDLDISAQVEFEDYYRKESEHLDVLHISTIVSAARHSFKKSASLSFTWLGDRYTNTTKLNSINRFEGTLRGQYY